MPQSQPVMYQVEAYSPKDGWQPLGPARAKKGRAMAARAGYIKVIRANRAAYSFTMIRLQMITESGSLTIAREVIL